MSETIISVENLGKCYRINHQQSGPNDGLRHVLNHWATAPIRALRGLRQKPESTSGGPSASEDFWALRDVSFEIKQGEVVGIIGRNGAGKSTLLKILSRITEPTQGRVRIKGRVASLLEVGTGFHPELTGRENVYLNGAILGMSRAEIKKKFDEIVAFAEVEKFLDTPVKRYSSGMYVRLAFAVAAHLEPEILIVDEVLAVGDVAFQKKCLGKMHEVSKVGRTVLFVSHNIAAISQLTMRCLLLRDGVMVLSGLPETVIEKYLNTDSYVSSVDFNVESSPREYLGNEAARILRLRFDKNIPQFKADEAFSFVITVRANSDLDRLRASITITSSEGIPVGGCFSLDNQNMTKGEIQSYKLVLSKHYLAPGHYFCDVGIGKGDPQSGLVDYDVVPRTLQFEVQPESGAESTVSYWQTCWGRIIYPKLHIQPESVDA